MPAESPFRVIKRPKGTLDEGPHARLLHLLNRTIGPCIIRDLA
jgi:hypothetical protein